MAGTRGGLPHVPAIDGLRGVAVALVLAFHGGVPGTSGGFLGVSLFFTLSGYLITQLLVQEWERNGRISLRAFWGRRLRRLAPASLLALVVIATAVALTGAFPGVTVPGDLAAAAGEVANWRFAAATTSYEDLFSAGPSPVLHFWSLAIEEQFYLLFPLLVVGVLGRFGRRALAPVFLLLIAAGTVASVVSPTDLAYYGTHARAPELLAGSLLALALPIGRELPTRVRRTAMVAGCAAAALLGTVVATTPVDRAWLYQGGLPAVSLLSAALIAATLVPGPVRAVASWAPAVALGRISYGAYLYHWPLYLVLSEERTGLDGPVLFALRLTASLAAAVVSARLLEEPIRRGARLTRARPAAGALAGAVAAVAVLAAVASPRPAPDLVPDTHEELVAFTEPAPPILEVLVAGSVPELAAQVRALAPSGVELRVRTATVDGEVTTPAAGTAPVPDVVVVGLSAADRAGLADELAAMAPGSPTELEATGRALAASDEILAAVLTPLPDAPTLIVDTGPDDPLRRQLRALSLRDRRITATDSAALPRDLRSMLDDATADDRLRVLVIGDSTSFQLATALDAGGRDRVEVLWAGRQNCALAPTHAVRWYAGAEFAGTECPSASQVWPEAVATLEPDVVLAAASLPELADHRYHPGGPWEAPGSDAYVAAHDAAMADLQALVAPTGALTIVATVPALIADDAFGGQLAAPERIAAWSAQLARWDERWRSVGTVDWAAITAAAEATAGRDLRVDAVHFEPDAVRTALARPLVDALLGEAARLRREATRTGCLETSSTGRRLDPARCAAAAAGP